MKNKKIFIVSAFLVLAAVVGNRLYASSKKRKEEEAKRLAEERVLQEMRKKYANIKNWNDFHIGIRYMPNYEIFGYDLRMLNRIENLDKRITFEELKFLYEMSKIDIRDIEPKKQDEILRIMGKIYN